ncbi:hypothetical protein SAMN04488005_2395 [Yoonia tamlensis]|uniref:Dolichyl-phosphate-mannose-protein mannosyltransferase n=1 Tax=Yoonia tamlensis TaxID=390270 RepID=A0A1I6GZV8_9RHOB|nr:hypothetical protein [Yoonia tamlensis]SFR47637.1 hypothetical protein SAMN04488005_2395 [Yoonia tamlensis]
MIKDKALLLSLLCAALGSLLYGMLVFGFIMPNSYPYFGTEIYNAYFYRLLEGRFDLPLRMLLLEGHYRADGTGYLYHGIAPLLTRVLLHPFVALNEFPTAAFSIWLWATIGTGFYHLAIFQVVRKYFAQIPVSWVAVGGLAIWICSPGFLLSNNPVLYHEPMGIAYAAMAVAVYLMWRCALFGMAWRSAVVPAALMAGVLLHARPHLAVGLYAGVLLMLAFSIWDEKRRAIVPAMLSLAILGIMGLSFLHLNKVRFGSATAAHGQIESPEENSQVQYAPVFFGSDYATDGRGVVFVEHGRFHPWRIVPNALIYVLDTPIVSPEIAALHRRATEHISGHGYIESPRFGMLSLWTVWVVLALVGFGYGRPRISGGARALPLLMTTGVAAVLMLSYPTVALRYKTDVWPFMMALCLLGLPGLIARFAEVIEHNRRVFLIGFILALCGVLTSALVTIPLRKSYQQSPGQTYESWGRDRCLAELAEKAFSPARLEQLCVDPESVFEERDES